MKLESETFYNENQNHEIIQIISLIPTALNV